MKTRQDLLGKVRMVMPSDKGSSVRKGSIPRGLALQSTICPWSSKAVSFMDKENRLVVTRGERGWGMGERGKGIPTFGDG